MHAFENTCKEYNIGILGRTSGQFSEYEAHAFRISLIYHWPTCMFALSSSVFANLKEGISTVQVGMPGNPWATRFLLGLGLIVMGWPLACKLTTLLHPAGSLSF